MKQIIVMRKDLNMRKGKMVAQGAHASLGIVTKYGLEEPRIKEWLAGPFKKVCVSVDSELELEHVHAKATARGLLTSWIVDSGLTEFGGVPTATCIAIGPDTDENLDPVTGELKLL